MAFSWHPDVTCSEIPGKVTQKKGKVKVSHFMRCGKWGVKNFNNFFKLKRELNRQKVVI